MNRDVPIVIWVASFFIFLWAIFSGYWAYRAFALGDPVQGIVVGVSALGSLAFALAPCAVKWRRQ